MDSTALELAAADPHFAIDSSVLSSSFSLIINTKYLKRNSKYLEEVFKLTDLRVKRHPHEKKFFPVLNTYVHFLRFSKLSEP